MKLYINSVDASSYLLSCSKVPIVHRNRDWSPVFNGIRISISSKMHISLSKDLEILIEWETVPHFLGYITRVMFDYKKYTWEIEVNHFIMKLDQYKVGSEDLHSLLENGIADFSTETDFTVDATGDYVISNGHSLSNGNRIQVRNIGGALPGGLNTYKNYWVYVRDGNSFYLFDNFADYSTMDISATSTARKVDITSAGSGTHRYTKIIDTDKYNDWGFFRDIPISSVDATLDQIFANAPYPSIPSEGNYHGDYGYPYFTLVAFYGEDLPSPLSEGRVYIAAKFEEDSGFILYENINYYQSNSRINLTDAGSGEMWFSIIMRFGLLDVLESEIINVPYPTSFIGLKWLITKIFGLIGITLDSTDIDNIVYHRFSLTSWKWNNVLVMEQMLYNLNQSSPVRSEDIVIGSDYESSQITCLEFIQGIFGKLGINFKYVGNHEYLLVPQKRDASYFITPDEELWYDIPNNKKLDFSQENIPADENGWIHSRFFGGFAEVGIPSALSFVYNDRDSYSNHPADVIEYNKSRSGAGRNTIDWWNHLLLFLINQSVGNNSVMEASILTTLYDITITGDTYSILLNEKNAATKDFISQEIECRASSLDQEIWSVKELYLDIMNRRINIIQERTIA